MNMFGGGSSANSMWNKAQVAIGIKAEEEQSMPQRLINQAENAFGLTWQQRLIGFGICFGLGVLLSFMSLIMLWSLNIIGFAVVYTFGAVLALISTMFLMGPCTQIKRMFDEHRILATCVYLGAIVVTLIVAFTVHGLLGLLLVIVCIIIQFAAFVWYALTYIPGGQAMLKAVIFRGG